MKEVIIKSKIVGKEGAIGGGKPIAFPDLSAYALRSDFIRLESSFNDFLEGDDTDNVINRWKELEAFLNNISEDYNLLSLLNGKADKATTLCGYGITDAYTKTSVDDLLLAYVTLGGRQTITGEKNFTGGLKVNGSPIYYDTEKKYWKLEGDLLVTGGVTMYGSDSSFVPSTIMDALLYDDATLGINSNGQLYVKGGTSGGGLDITALQNYLTQNSYLNVTEGDGRYLKLSGGTISNNGYALILNRESENPVWIQFRMQNEFVGAIGGENGALRFMDKNSIVNTVWHSGNFNPSNYLPLSGGTITVESGTIFDATFGKDIFGYNPSYGVYIGSTYNDGNSYWIYSGCHNNPNPLFNKDGELCTIWHSGNDGSGSGLDADLLDGKQPSELNVASATYSPNTSKLYSTDNVYSYGSANPYYGYLTYNQTYDEWDFKVSPNTPEYIHVYSSDKLRTARTIWGQSFDGTGNISGDIGNTSAIAFDTSRGAVDIGYLWTNTLGMHMDMSGLGTEWQGTNFTITPPGNVGIGTPTPKGKLDINGSTWIGAGDYVANRATLLLNSNKGNAADIIFKNGSTTTGNYGTWAISVRHESDHRFSIWRGGENGSVASELEVLKLYANGNLLVVGGITMYSDQRKKTIISHVELSLKQIADAPLIEHYYNGDDKKTTHVGSIAQYWANMNDWFCKLDNEGYYTMEIQNAALASAISIARELDRYETKTDKAIKKLKKRICELEEEVKLLKAS